MKQEKKNKAEKRPKNYWNSNNGETDKKKKKYIFKKPAWSLDPGQWMDQMRQTNERAYSRAVRLD